MKVKEYTNIQDYIKIKNKCPEPLKSCSPNNYAFKGKPKKDNYIDSQENRLLEKKDLLKMVEPQHLEKFKKWRVSELRNHFKLTHKINGKYENMNGYCFKCLTPLRPDYIQYENYCKDC